MGILKPFWCSLGNLGQQGNEGFLSGQIGTVVRAFSKFVAKDFAVETEILALLDSLLQAEALKGNYAVCISWKAKKERPMEI